MVLVDGTPVQWVEVADRVGLPVPTPQQIPEPVDLRASAAELLAAPPFPDIPLAVLTRGVPVFADPELERAWFELRNLLVARGVPADAVRFVHEAATDDAKARLLAYPVCSDGRAASSRLRHDRTTRLRHRAGARYPVRTMGELGSATGTPHRTTLAGRLGNLVASTRTRTARLRSPFRLRAAPFAVPHPGRAGAPTLSHCRRPRCDHVPLDSGTSVVALRPG